MRTVLTCPRRLTSAVVGLMLLLLGLAWLTMSLGMLNDHSRARPMPGPELAWSNLQCSPGTKQGGIRGPVCA